MSNELKPVRCGCGGEANVFGYDALSGDHDFYVNCTKCGICTPSKPTKAEAIEAWNRAMGTNTRKLLEVLVHDATDTNVGDKDIEIIRIPIPVDTNSERNKVWSCPVCGQYMHRTSWGRDNHYCPSCGARMEWK